MNRIDVLLMEITEGGNLGSICRALKTLGFPPPRLVAAPPGIEESRDARRLAHGAREYLHNLKRYEKLEDALGEYDFVIGTTARPRRTVSEYIEAERLPELLKAKGEAVRTAALLFGGEAAGLSSESLNRCDLVSTVPLATDYPSLNLAQAVLLYAYELSPIEGERSPEVADGQRQETASYRALAERVERVLERRRGNPALGGRITERLSHLREGDIRLLHSVLNLLEEEPPGA